jgi:signal transduction histidine kinase
VDALLGNVFAHTADGVGFRVGLIPRPRGGAVLIVEDDGPGLADAEVLRRGESKAGSSGLGLDIARRSAEASGGWLRLGSRKEGTGLSVTMELGPAA